MALAQLSRAGFSRAVVGRGDRYFRQRRVSFTSQTKDGAIARVRGSGGTYTVELDWRMLESGALGVSCTCPYFDGGSYCKHIWAAILAADEQNILAGRALPRRLLVVDTGEEDEADLDDIADEDGDEYIPESEYDDHDLGSASFITRTGGRSQPPYRGSWQVQLQDALRQTHAAAPLSRQFHETGKRREAWYVLDVGHSLRTGLAIQLMQRETRQNGEFGKIKRLQVRRSELTNWAGTSDYELLEQLFTYDDSATFGVGAFPHYGYYGSEPSISLVALSPRGYQIVLPKLCATGRFRWMLAAGDDVEQHGRPVDWDDGPPWQFRLSVAADGKQWVLRGQLLRDGLAEPLPLDRPALITRGGLLLLEDRLSQHRAGDHFGWISVLRRDGEIRVPHSQQADFLQRLWNGAPSLPDIDWPPGLRPNEVRVPPRGVVQFERPKYQSRGGDQLIGHLHFEYAGQRIAAHLPAAGLVAKAGDQVWVRDRDQERALLAQLVTAGVRLNDRNYGHAYDADLPARRLPEVVERLLAADWTVEAEGHLLRRGGDFNLSIRSNVDWFELDGEFDFDGVSATLPDLLAAIRKGERYVRLGDGTHGLLPEEWLKKFGTMADLGTEEAGKLRFRPTQALLLDALLASQPNVTFDRRFAQVRKKIESFRGIEPLAEPKGFVGELRPYQREGLGWLGFLREFGFGGCLADDMGLGKTIQVLALLQAARNKRPPAGQARRPSLVVVPRSLVFNWLEEARRFTPKLRVLDLSQKDRGSLIHKIGEYDVALTTYGTLIKDIGRLKDVPLEYAVLDESQAVKNAQSQSAKACRLLQAEHRLAMTGTPIENHLGELWSLLEFLNPGMLGRSSALARLTASTNGDGPDREGLAALSRAIAPFILRRTKRQVLKDLPDKTEQTIHCDLSPAERKHYDELRDYYRASLGHRIEAEGLAKSKIHVLEALLRLRQAACHRGLLDAKLAPQPSAKLDMLLEQIEELIDEGHKALVFSQFTSLLAIVRERFDKRGWTYEYLDGQTRNRQEKVERFQSDAKCPLFLVSLKAGGRGLNLTAADYVFILDPWWNPAVEAQAVDRAHRIGQSRHVFAYRLIAKDTVEEKILELQQSKRDLADAIIDADKSLLQKLTADDLKLLLS